MAGVCSGLLLVCCTMSVTDIFICKENCRCLNLKHAPAGATYIIRSPIVQFIETRENTKGIKLRFYGRPTVNRKTMCQPGIEHVESISGNKKSSYDCNVTPFHQLPKQPESIKRLIEVKSGCLTDILENIGKNMELVEVYPEVDKEFHDMKVDFHRKMTLDLLYTHRRTLHGNKLIVQETLSTTKCILDKLHEDISQLDRDILYSGYE